MILDRYSDDFDWEADRASAQQKHISLEAASSFAIKEVLGGQYDIEPLAYYAQYDDFEDPHYDFCEKNHQAQNEIYKLRQSQPRSNRRFYFGYDNRGEEEISEDGIEPDFADYAHILKIIEASGAESVDIEKYLGDTKFLYTPLIVRPFFDLDGDDHLSLLP